MRKLVFFPSDPISAYIEKGRSYQYLDEYYNPGGFFDEVYCLSPWGDVREEKIGNITYIKENPLSFRSLIKKISPDVIRGYGGYCCADWASINKIGDIPVVVSVHDTNPKLIHKSLEYADYIICMSKAVQYAVTKKVSIPIEKTYIMPNRIDVDLFCKKNDPQFFDRLNNQFGNCKHILHVGRKAKQKNIDTVIKSLQYLDDDVSCIFVGQGDWERYSSLAKKSGVQERCFFVDRVETSDLPYWYSWCDCFCVPSLWEGFGMVFVEAASCEAPIVTSNIAPMNEYLNNMKNAILVDDYTNPVKIAHAIQKVLSNDEEILQIRKNAREVGFRFEKNSIDKMEIDIYKKAIIGRGKGVQFNELRWQMLSAAFKGKIKSFLK